MTNRQIAAKLVARRLQSLHEEILVTDGPVVAKLAGQSKLTQKRLDAILGHAKELIGPLVTKMAKKGLARPPKAKKEVSLDLTDKSPELAALKVDDALANAVTDVATSQTPEFEEVPF